MLNPLSLRCRNAFLLLLVVVALANPVFLFAQEKQKEPQPGRLRIKVSPEFATQLRQARIRTARVGKDNVVLLGIKSMDAVHRRFKVNNLKRVFRDAGIFEAKHRKYGLDRWYEITMDSTLSVEEALQSFGGLEYVEKAEPLYRKRLADVGPQGMKAVVVDSPPTPGIGADGPDDPLFDSQWHYHNTGQTGGRPGADIHVLKAWQLEAGKPNVVVAVMDGGIQYTHPDLAANMWRNENEIPGNAIDDDNNGYVDDVYGYGFGDDVGDMLPDMHGTHVAGTIAAVNNNGIGVAGVAGGSGNGDGVRLMSCAVFGRTNQGNFPESYVYAADMGAVISQNSWGYFYGYEQAVLDAIDYFIAEAGKDLDGNQIGPMNGGTVIFSAGNDDSSEYGTWPGQYEPVLGIAATTHEDVRTYYSNYGFWVDIAAPGGYTEVANSQGVLSTLTPSTYGYLQGTSMACPHVSGVAALLVSKFGGPGYDHTTLENRLKSTTDDINPLNPNYAKQLGKGRLNATKALYIPDSLAPLPIQDLFVSSIMHNALTLTWTGPSDANDFSVAGYDLRYSTHPITPENFDAATAVGGVPPSNQQGGSESFTIEGLSPNTTYYIGMKSMDGAGHTSELSNVVTQRTYSPPVLDVASSVMEVWLTNGRTKDVFNTLYNRGEAPLHYNFVYTEPKENHIAIVEPESGVIAAGDSAHIKFTFRSMYLPPGFYSMDLQLMTNDPGNSEAIIQTNLELTQSSGPILDVQRSLEFGDVEVHHTKRLELRLGNIGHPYALVIDTAFFSDPQYSTPANFPITILDLEATSIPIDFTPTTTGSISEQLTLVLREYPFSESVGMYGESYDPYLGISVRPQSLSETLDFDEPTTRTLVVRNSSSQPVSIAVAATNDVYNTPLPVVPNQSLLKEHEAAMKTAAAQMDLYSPRILPGMEKLSDAWPTVPTTPTQHRPSFQYATDFEGFNLGRLSGQSGWSANPSWAVKQGDAVSGQKYIHYTPPLDGYGFIYSPRVSAGTESRSSMKVNVRVGSATNTGWQIVPSSPSTGYVVTRILIDFQHGLSALVNDGGGNYHVEPIPVTLPDGYNEIGLELTRATSEFSIYLNGVKIFTGVGFASRIEQLVFYAANDGTMDLDNAQIIDGDVASLQYLSVNPSASTIAAGDSVSLTVNFQPAYLTYGDYESFIHVTPAGGQTLSVPVSLSIPGPAYITTASPVTARVPSGSDTTARLSIRNEGGAPVTYALSLAFPDTDTTWLSLSHTTGTLPVATAAITTLTVDATNLPPGEYTATLVITSNAPLVEVPVVITVLPPPQVEVQSTHLAFQNEYYPWYEYLNFRNTGGSRLYYTVKTSTAFRTFRHAPMTPPNNDPVQPGPSSVPAIANTALPFIGESYDDELSYFIATSNMNGQDGWAADGNEWFGMSPYEYAVNIQGKSNGTGIPSMMFSPVVDQGSENVSSISMLVNLMGSKGTTWQFIPQSPTQGHVVTRLQINPDQSIQVLVKNNDGSASFQRVHAIVAPQFFDLTIKVDRLTSSFVVLFDGQKVFTGKGFADQIEQMAFLSLMEKEGSSIFMRTYKHYNCASLIQFNEDWYWTNETSGFLEPGASTEMYVTYMHTDLDQGVYNDSIRLITNDPVRPVVKVPFTITVNVPYVEPSDYKSSPALEILTDSLFAETAIGDSTTVFVTLRNDSDDTRNVYFPIPVELDHEYRSYYNRSANFRWVDISTTGQKLDIGDDESLPVQLPFVFYYANGVSSDYISVGSNGIIGHGVQDVSTPLNVPFSYYNETLIFNKLAVYWDDLATDEHSGIYFAADEEKAIVQYDNVLIYGTDARNTFQVIFYNDGVIKYQYLSMDDRFSATIGLSNGYFPTAFVSNEPFVTDSLAIIFQYEVSGTDDENSYWTYVIHPWVRYPSAPFSIPPHTTVDVPIILKGLTSGLNKGNITLLSYETTPYNYPDWTFPRIDGGAFVVPVELNVGENPPPVLGEIEDMTMSEGTYRHLTFTATDPNDSAVAITVQNMPSFMLFIDASDGAANYALQPGLEHVGNYQIIVRATDPHGATDVDTLHLSVIRYSVTNFSLVNSETGEVLFDFTDAVTINQADPDFSTFTIRAHTSPETVGSVKFRMDGPQVNIDNTNPYQLKSRHLLTLSEGTHTILAEPFTAESGHEHRGGTKQATVTVIHATNVVVDFSLVNMVTGEVLLNFNDAITIDRARPDFANLNIRANTIPAAVGSVKFKVNGTQRNIDNSDPYLLKSGVLTSLSSGNYTLLAEPFTGANGGGQRGQGKQAIITINEAPIRIVDFSLINVATGEVISNFTNMITLNRNRPDLAQLTVRANTSPATVPSVKFKVNGSQRNIDSTTPYLLKTQVLPTLSTGENVLLAEPFSEPNGHGQRGEVREAKIILEDVPVTISFSLVNITTGQVVQTFDHPISIDRRRGDFANLNIRANTAPAVVGSVKFKINGSQRNIDSSSPYLLAGQALQNFPTGNTQLYAEPFTLSNGHGEHGELLEVTVTVLEGSDAAKKMTNPGEETASAKTLEVYPVPVIDILRIKTDEYDNRAFQMVVVNAMGQTAFKTQIASGALNSFAFSTNSVGMASGVYYVHFVDASGARVVKKVVKQ